MKTLARITFNFQKCQSEVAAFRTLLKKRELSERRDILPFFQKNKQLSALIGCHNPRVTSPNLVAHEFHIFGDYIADLVVGDSRTGAFCFVEFEDGKSNSIFVKGKRSKAEWSPRFEHGYSQVIDWFYKLADLQKTDGFKQTFGFRSINLMGVLVIGRSTSLTSGDRLRLRWRMQHVIVSSNHVLCLTFDDLFEDAEFRLEAYSAAAKVLRNDRR